ncbi:MAG: cysteine-rich CWC family protein [Thermodesulfobacteriota bacterium]|nr:cysteine-rich CWC family protein [Thermodesulfobacteriota bacterium]
MNSKTNETICPLCQKDNGCMAHSNKRCWCVDMTIPQALLDQVPAAQQGRACICRSCIEKFNHQQGD